VHLQVLPKAGPNCDPEGEAELKFRPFKSDPLSVQSLPPSIYAIIGILIITNLSTVGAVIVFIFKCGFFVAETKSGILDAKATAVRAHRRIDSLDLNQGDENETCL